MMLSNKKPDCKRCGYTVPLPENYEFIHIINKWGFIIGDGFGGIKIDAIDFIINNENVDRDEFIEKARIYFGNGMSSRHNEKETSIFGFQE